MILAGVSFSISELTINSENILWQGVLVPVALLMAMNPVYDPLPMRVFVCPLRDKPKYKLSYVGAEWACRQCHGLDRSSRHRLGRIAQRSEQLMHAVAHRQIHDRRSEIEQAQK